MPLLNLFCYFQEYHLHNVLLMLKNIIKNCGLLLFILKMGEMIILHVLDACFFYYFLYNRKNDNAERRNK